MNFKSINDFNYTDQVVLVRADLNVPAKDGIVSDTTRIDRLKPTIDYLTKNSAKVIVLSHFGRPKGKPNQEYSLSFLPSVLKERWNLDVRFANDCIGPKAQKLIENLKPGEVGLLENVRFHQGEETNDPEFANQLSELGTLFINDAFSAAHRAHASTEGIAHLLPTAAGMNMEKEINALTAALEKPNHPVVAIVGGAKISTKLAVLDNLVKKVDTLVLGGGMANTFLFAKGIEVGKSLCETDMADQALEIMNTAKTNQCKILVPEHRVIVSSLEENTPYDVCDLEMDTMKMAVDIADKGIQQINEICSNAKTVLWNGPLGVFEIKPFDNATNLVSRHVANLTKEKRIVSIAGGGDTVAALENAGVAKEFSYVSTAGGAFLEWLEGKTLPGIAALSAYKEAA